MVTSSDSSLKKCGTGGYNLIASLMHIVVYGSDFISSLCRAFVNLVSIQIIIVVTIQIHSFRSALIVFPVYTSPDASDVWPNNRVSMICLKYV